jgi:hypothetical protein
MKCKQFLLAAFSFLLAVTAAVASRQTSGFFAPETVFVKAKLTASSPTTCVNTGVTCNSSGTQVCCVRLNVATGSDVACTNGLYKSYRSGCTQVLFGDTQEWAISSVSVHSLVAN